MMLMGTKRKINKKNPSASAKVIYEDVKVKADSIAGEMGENVRKHVDKARAEAGEDVKALKGRRSDRKKLHLFSGIRFKITVAFIVPVVLMIGLGVISYNRSAEALTSNYESSSKSTLDTAASYMNLIIETIRTASYDISVSTIAREYYGQTYAKDAYKESTVFSTLRTEIESRKIANKYIRNIAFVANYGNAISTALSYLDDSIYENVRKLDCAKRTDKEDFIWLGNHPELDDYIGTSRYAFGIMRKAYNMKFRQIGYVVVDVDYDEIANHIASINMGENAILALITPDGREISYKNIPVSDEAEGQANDSLDTEYIVNSELYDKILASEENGGSEYVEYNGEKYLLLYNKLESQGFMMVSLVPESYIIADADETARLTAAAVAVTALIVIVIGFILSTSMGTTIRKIMNGLEKASTGDLTVDIHTRRKDEFMILCESTNQMLGNIRALINKADTVAKALGNASERVGGNSGILLEETKSITTSISDVEKGIVMQANDAENCLTRMDDLSKKIGVVSENTGKIADIADVTKSTVSDGLATIDTLQDKVKATTQVTAEVISNIEDLEKASQSIANIVGAINDIADETSLLSLNASIEAARAGENGRGFAVVAEEIRVLADQSTESAEKIKNIIEKLIDNSNTSVQTMKSVVEEIAHQNEKIDNTRNVFGVLKTEVDNVTSSIEGLAGKVEDLNGLKNSVTESVESLAAIAQENAAGTQETSASMVELSQIVNDCNQDTSKLVELAKELQENIGKFKLSE